MKIIYTPSSPRSLPIPSRTMELGGRARRELYAELQDRRKKCLAAGNLQEFRALLIEKSALQEGSRGRGSVAQVSYGGCAQTLTQLMEWEPRRLPVGFVCVSELSTCSTKRFDRRLGFGRFGQCFMLLKAF